MLSSTSFQNHIVDPDRPGALVSRAQERFIMRSAQAIQTVRSNGTNECQLTSPPEQKIIPRDGFVRVPSIRDSKWKIMVLQRWIGRVEQVFDDRFVAVLHDATNHQNPLEQVELDRQDISKGDFPLIIEGAIFYWSISYTDTPGGQRERSSIIRFARLPRLNKMEVKQISDKASRLAAFLESA